MVLDIDAERIRINNVFKGKKYKETKERLHALMDAIEDEKWQKAYDMLEGEWWNGRDEKLECPRVEFIGSPALDMKNEDIGMFEMWASYADVVCYFVNHPKNYKIVKKEVD
jgi:hypothetical protein